MKSIYPILILAFAFLVTSCITTKEVKYLQPNESLVIDEEGLVPYNIQEYRATYNDIFNLRIITTPKGDAAQFYSTLNAGSIGGGTAQDTSSDNNFYFNGLRTESDGTIYVFGIGNIQAEGRTLESIRDEIQTKVNENFLVGKSEVRLTLNGIKYYFLGDIESTGLTGEKVSHKQTLNILEAISENGGLNRTIDRSNVTLQRRYPEGIKTVKIDLTREDIMNSPYYWIQNGDVIFLNTRPKSFYGFGSTPLQTLTTGVTVLTTALSIYLILSRL